MRGEAGKALAWVLAFVALAGAGLATLVGVGCALRANSCPFRRSAPQTSTDPEMLWLANCAVCHGRDGSGTQNGPSLVSGARASLSQAELEAKIGRGKPLAGMPAFKRSLSRDQIAAVVRYLVALRSRPVSPSPGTS